MMHIKLAHLLFWAFLLTTLIIGGAIFYEKNQDGVTYYRACVQSGGKWYDPRFGERPECEVYDNVAQPEGKLRAVTRGIGEALPFSIFLGLAGLFIGDKLDGRREHEKKR